MMATTVTEVVVLLVAFSIVFPSHQHQLHVLKKMSRSDVGALAAVKDSLTDIPGSYFFSSWDFSAPDPCSTFAGITCFLNRVTTLTLGTGLSGSPGLAGSLSPAISNLTQLTQLVLYSGLVTGPIPPQLSRLTNLRVISLTNNRLTGPIPSSISSLPKLHTLDLSYNQLSGPIPVGLFMGSTALKVLILGSNRLSGGLPSKVSTELLHFDLKNNLLTGMLPLRMPSSVRYVSVSNNRMWGPINGLSSEELSYLDLSMNHFNGPIPPTLFRPTLSLMLLQRNNLSGGVPFSHTPLGYGEGSTIDLSHNQLTGQLSSILSGVESLFLNNNRLRGKVPEEYGGSVFGGTTKTLYLQHNYFSDFPVLPGLALPDTVSVCLSYNCMTPPLGLTACPASAGAQLSRPDSQCALFNNTN